MRQHTVQTPYMVGEVHFYTTELESGLALFDTGPPTADGEKALREAVDFDRLKYLFLTHCHVDHYGLAAYVLRNSAAEIFIARKDAVKINRHTERIAAIAALLAGYGFSEEFISTLRDSFKTHNVFPQAPEKYTIIEDAAALDPGVSWLPCPGHSQSDLVYLTGGYAVSGDLLLKNIFQAPLLDIDLATFSGRFRNYAAYCSSLGNLVRLRDYRIMPGHRQGVQSLDEAVLFYVRTLLERAVQILAFKDHPLPEIIDRLFNGRLTEPFFVYLKLSEIVFMLDFIENPETLKAALEQIGLFGTVSTLFDRFV